MKSKLDEFRQRVWRIKLAEGILAAAFGLVVSYLCVFLLDRVWDTPGWLRATFLIGGAVGAGVLFPLKCHYWLWQTRRLERVARLLGNAFPRLSDHLLGIIELVQAEGHVDGSVQLAQAALKQVDEETQDKDFTGAVPNPKHRKWAWTFGIPAGVALLVLVILPAAGFNAFGRWLMPWSDTPRYTFAQLENVPDELIVPYAESFELKTQLASGTSWTPESGSAQYERQQPIEAPLKQGDKASGYDFKVPAQKKEGQLKVAVGDFRKSITVKPTTRPELTSMVAEVRLPEYLQRDEALTRDVRGGSISIVKGSEAVFKAESSRDLAVAKVDGKDQAVDGSALKTAPMTIGDSISKVFTWKDKLGLSAKTPFVLKILGQEDEAPTVIGKNTDRELVLLETETLRMDVQANDDFGVKVMGVEWYGVADAIRNPRPAKGEKIVAAGGPEHTELLGVATFSPKLEEVEPQIIKLRVFAEDFLPDRKRAYSSTYTVYVLSPEEHAVYLTNELRRWFQKAQETYEKEQQLFDENQRIRRLSDEELDKPETRRRIEAQASAEQANGRRLAQLTQIGEEIVQQATRNEEFNVETLETLAEQLQALKDISENRMPSVADMLKDSANAKGGKKGQAGKPGQGKPNPGKQGQGKSDGQSQDGKPSGQQGENTGDSKSDSQVKNSGEQKPGESSQSDSSNDTKSVGNNRNQQGGKGEPKDSPPSKLPGISDVESGYNKKPKDKEKLDDEKQQGGGGKFGLPGTTLIGGGDDDDDDDNASCPAAKKLDKAIEEQENLLDEFAKVADELQRILDNLEGSTFVKRLKAASRRQLTVAKDLNNRLLGAFGVTSGKLEDKDHKFAERVAKRETTESDTVYIIQEDLEAYFNRVKDGKYKTILEEMKDVRVVTKLKEMGDSVKDNLNGQTIAEAEFWSDNLDRWAEQLVGPG